MSTGFYFVVKLVLIIIKACYVCKTAKSDMEHDFTVVFNSRKFSTGHFEQKRT